LVTDDSLCHRKKLTLCPVNKQTTFRNIRLNSCSLCSHRDSISIRYSDKLFKTGCNETLCITIHIKLLLLLVNIVGKWEEISDHYIFMKISKHLSKCIGTIHFKRFIDKILIA